MGSVKGSQCQRRGRAATDLESRLCPKPTLPTHKISPQGLDTKHGSYLSTSSCSFGICGQLLRVLVFGLLEAFCMLCRNGRASQSTRTMLSLIQDRKEEKQKQQETAACQGFISLKTRVHVPKHLQRGGRGGTHTQTETKLTKLLRSRPESSQMESFAMI